MPTLKISGPKSGTNKKGTKPPPVETRKNRTFPKHGIAEALVVAQKIHDEGGGHPMPRLLLADALSVTPSSSAFRELLSSAYRYGFIDGTEKSDTIGFGENGAEATQRDDPAAKLRALRAAALKPTVFGAFFRNYANKRLPSADLLPKILRSQYSVPEDLADECAKRLHSIGTTAEIVREIGGSPRIMLDGAGAIGPGIQEAVQETAEPPPGDGAHVAGELSAPPTSQEPSSGKAPASETPLPLESPAGPTGKPIFIGHGKNKGPLEQLKAILTMFGIPYRVVIEEPNLGRPIPDKVRETITECGSAILLFTRDEKFFDASGNELWRPSENVVHELGATSYVYGNRIVIFKEKGLHLASNFASIGYIEFEPSDIQAKAMDLMKELIGFGLVRLTPAA